MKNSYFKIDSLLREAKKGNQKAKEKIVFILEGLIVNKIKKYNYSKESYEDLIQEGRYIILLCIENYNKSKGTYFLGYVKSQLRYKYLNLSKKFSNKEYPNLNSSIDPEGNIELVDLLEADFSAYEFIYVKQVKDILNKNIEKLTERQGQIIYYYYYQNLTMKDIGKTLNISYRTVVNTKKSALKKLKYFLKSGKYI